ncbi:MAG: hypothetical protein HEQ23_05495 [Tepidisphaera sp.]
MVKGTRVTLTAKEAGSPQGKTLLNVILSMIHDGDISLAEIVKLHDFLVGCPIPMNAVAFLRPKTRAIISDDRVDAAEAYDLKRAFIRVVTKEVRGVIETHLEAIGAPPKSRDRAPAWHQDPATERQIQYIVDLGGTVTFPLTKGQASVLIDELLERRPPTPRQIMVLRFFDRMDLANSGKDQVSEWIDTLFGGLSPAERAWERFKRETKHDPLSSDAECVPIGAYRQYMPATT